MSSSCLHDAHTYTSRLAVENMRWVFVFTQAFTGCPTAIADAAQPLFMSVTDQINVSPTKDFSTSYDGWMIGCACGLCVQ